MEKIFKLDISLFDLYVWLCWSNKQKYVPWDFCYEGLEDSVSVGVVLELGEIIRNGWDPLFCNPIAFDFSVLEFFWCSYKILGQGLL